MPEPYDEKNYCHANEPQRRPDLQCNPSQAYTYYQSQACVENDPYWEEYWQGHEERLRTGGAPQTPSPETGSAPESANAQEPGLGEKHSCSHDVIEPHPAIQSDADTQPSDKTKTQRPTYVRLKQAKNYILRLGKTTFSKPLPAGTVLEQKTSAQLMFGDYIVEVSPEDYLLTILSFPQRKLCYKVRSLPSMKR